jgi:hypothetical protein
VKVVGGLLLGVVPEAVVVPLLALLLVLSSYLRAARTSG